MATVGDTALHWGDFVVIACYFAIVLFIGLWSSRSNRGSVGGYFLAGRNMHWIPVGASIFASNIGSAHFVGLAGSGASGGIAIASYELNAIFVVLMLGWLFVPVYLSSGVFTMPEYLKKRFGGKRIQVYLAFLSLLLYIFTKCSSDLYAGAIFVERSLKWDMYGGIFGLLTIAAIFTITGGLTAVIWTDFIQTILMVIGAIALTILGFSKVGGYDAMVRKYPVAIANETLFSNGTCGYPRKDYMHLFRDPVTGDLPWPGTIGMMINSMWYWCADQVIVQRALASKNITHAKAGTVLTGVLKILPLFVLVMPGMIARILYPDEVACSSEETCMRVCGNKVGCGNIAYTMMVLNLMPDGGRGLMLAVMLAALVSSLTSIFNSSSTIFTIDIWLTFRKKASTNEQLVVGRVFVLILVALSILWVPVIRTSQGSDLFVYIQEISSFLQPPVIAVFILGIFWPRCNEKGAFAGLVCGLIVGLVRFVTQYSYDVPTCDHPEDNRPSIIKDFHYLYFAAFLFAFTIIVSVVISIITKPIDEDKLYRLVFWSRHSVMQRRDMEDAAHPSEEDKIQISKYEQDTVGEKEDDDDPGRLNQFEPMSMEQGDAEVKTFIPIWKRFALWVCGIEKTAVAAADPVEESVLATELLREENPWKSITNLSALLLICAAVILYAYYG